MCPGSSALAGGHIMGGQAWHGEAQESPEHGDDPRAEQLYRSPLKEHSQAVLLTWTQTQSPPASLGTGVFNLFKGGTSLAAGERCLTAL